MRPKLLDDINQKIREEHLSYCDFVSQGQIIKAGTIYVIEKDYPPSHHIDKKEE